MYMERLTYIVRDIIAKFQLYILVLLEIEYAPSQFRCCSCIFLQQIKPQEI